MIYRSAIWLLILIARRHKSSHQYVLNSHHKKPWHPFSIGWMDLNWEASLERIGGTHGTGVKRPSNPNHRDSVWQPPHTTGHTSAYGTTSSRVDPVWCQIEKIWWVVCSPPLAPECPQAPVLCDVGRYRVIDAFGRCMVNGGMETVVEVVECNGDSGVAKIATTAAMIQSSCNNSVMR